ncbi:MAG: DUF2243 domain-containing protein [Legionella sp.]|nr:DUF2243 domain-containing protein [Legionella sp.]
MRRQPSLRPAGLLLGIGLGGFLDGILFHQILQLHNMLSNVYFPNTLVNAEINMFWDGLFHAFTWLTTVAGLFFLWKALNGQLQKASSTYFMGLLLSGWGLFNIVEGTVDHLLLGIHHVVQRTSVTGQFYSDMLFLLSGIFLFLVGVWLSRRAQREPFARPSFWH